MDFNKAHSVENGIIIDEESGGPFYTGGTVTPVGLDLPTSTIYTQTTATGIKIWRKFGTGPNDWRQLSAEDIPFDVSALTTAYPQLVGLTQTQEVVGALAGSNFGNQFDTSVTTANIQTSSTSFITIHTHVTPVIPAGTYVVFAKANFEKSIVSGQIETRIFVNGTTAYDVSNVPLSDDDYRYTSVSFAVVPLTNSANTIEFQMRKSIGSGNIQADNRRIMLWRVS